MSVPSFTSFPQLEPEPLKSSQEQAETRPEKGKHDTNIKFGPSSKRNDNEYHRDGGSSRERHRGHRKRDKEKYGEKEKDGRRREDEKSEDLLDESYRLFYSDRKPDLLNIQYGGLHAGDIPKYRMVAGGGRAIGLPRGLILHRTGKGIEVRVKSRNNKLSSLTDSHTRSLLALPPHRRLVHSEELARYAEVDGFIRLPTRRGKHKPEDTYRSITEARDGDSTGSESDSLGEISDDSSDEPGDYHPETSQQAQIRVLEQQLAVNKGSVQTWLSLLDITLSFVPIASKNAAKARCDIALSVLQRAIDSDPATKASPLLRIKYLKAGEGIWDEAHLKEKWEEALVLNGVALWLEWLEWRIRGRQQGVDGVLEDMARLLSSSPFQGNSVEAELARLRVFWRIAVVMQDAGFTERAMAMFQAQLELTFYLPLHLSTSFSQQLDELDHFWEAEAPRTLEEGAKGWKHWYQSGRNGLSAISSSKTTEASIRELDPYRQWASQEAADDQLFLFPCRVTIETEGMDPYSTIFFSDIRSTLIRIKSPQAKQALRLVVLSFLGLPLPGISQILSLNDGANNWDDRWSMKAFTNSKHLAAIIPNESERQVLIGESIAGAVIAHEKEYRDSFGPVKNWGYESLSPLDVSVRGGKARPFFWNAVQAGSVNTKLVLRTFSQLRGGDDDFDWDSLALAFEAALNIKNALKLSKAFLSTPKDMLEYWNAHAQLERINGRLDAARKIYQTVLIASRPSASQHGLSALWWNWAEMEWLTGSQEQAVNVALRSVGIESTSGISVLRAKRSLDDLASITVGWRDKLNWVKLRALLELLNGADVNTALSIFDEQLSVTEGIVHESLTMASLLFIFDHRVVLKGPMPPAILRERAERALETYPSNSIILGVFLEGEKGQGVWGKVRSMLGAGDGRAKDVARRMEEVWAASWEKGRWRGEMERTRSGLAAAIEHERTRASPVVWRLYLEFEIKTGNYQNAKKLLFRAIGECPLVKELYLLAFGPLRSVFEGRELQSLADVMAERGIRLRRGLEEVVGIVQEANGGLEDNMDEDEIEHNARELRRLMPY